MAERGEPVIGVNFNDDNRAKKKVARLEPRHQTVAIKSASYRTIAMCKSSYFKIIILRSSETLSASNW